MLPSFASAGNRLALALAVLRGQGAPTPKPAPVVPLIRPHLARLAQPDAVLPEFVAHDVVTRKYLDLLGPLDWAHFPERAAHHPWPGPTPAPRAPYVCAYLIKLNEGLRSMGKLRTYLLEHPALVWSLGFPLVADPTAPHGFDVARSVPTRRQLGRVLRELDNAAAPVPVGRHGAAAASGIARRRQFRATSSPWIPSTSSPGSRKTTPKPTSATGTTRPNSPRATRTANWAARNATTKAMATVTRHRTQPPVPCPHPFSQPHRRPAHPRPTLRQPNPLRSASITGGGYASGIITTKVPDWGEFVLAELTQTFDHGDATYFFPLMTLTERRPRPPTALRRPRQGL